MKIALKIIGIVLAAGLVSLLCVYLFVLQYPKLKQNPKDGKWYRITGDDMLCSDGSRYKAFFRKGSENKVLIYFAGGGISINEETAREDMYIRRVAPIDRFANNMMNSGGLATATEDNPFRDWTVIVLPYATGDFHSGTNDFEYTDKEGKKKILYHHGYTNYTAVMQKAVELGGISDPEAVMVTGYSAGAGGASLLASDVFTNYFPDAKSKTVLVDAMLMFIDNWHGISADVWKSPQAISDRIRTNNIVLDSLTALHEDFGDDVKILFVCSSRDGELAKAQNLFDNGKPEVNETVADKFQQDLKKTMPQFKDIGAYLYIWDGLPLYDDPRNMTMHTIIVTPAVYSDPAHLGISVADWAYNATNGKAEDYGLDLVDKVYEKTE
ncbi:MAG: esterase [Ruminococcus sp.]|nr:esterase [Ruminococcus sp.]